MIKVKEHYEKHLGNFYSWMTGDFAQRASEHKKIFHSLGICETQNKTAIDLGCGHGIQTLALAQMGYQVVAVDFNRQLLDELASQKSSYPIDIIEGEISEFLEGSSLQVDLLTCMGDTITHFESKTALVNLFSLLESHLVIGGKIILSFRDLTQELKNESRFIPVKSDDNRILTCFLEYFPDHVVVHDILWEKTDLGWTQKVSAYPKLRLDSTLICKMLTDQKFIVRESIEINRLQYLVAEKIH